MSPEEIIRRVENGEVVIINTELQTILDRQKGDNFDAFFDWLESTNNPPGQILLENGKPWNPRLSDRVPTVLTKGNWRIENLEESEKEIYVYDASRRKAV